MKDSNVITERFFTEFTQKLPQRYQEGAPPVDIQPGAIHGGAEKAEYSPAQAALPPPQPPSRGPSEPQANAEVVEAMYEYQQRDPTDLPLRKGQRIEVLEKLNNDWWRGRDMGNGTEGIFPSNYVTPVSGDAQRGAPPPPPYQGEKGFNNNLGYTPPPAQQMPPAGAPPAPSPGPSSYATYPPPPANYYPPPMQQQPPPPPAQAPAPAPAPQQEQPQSESHLKKFGSKFGNAAIFGAGATAGSEIIHSIF